MAGIKSTIKSVHKVGEIGNETSLFQNLTSDMVGEGFEPSKLTCQIYSLVPLTAREPHRTSSTNEKKLMMGLEPATYCLQGSCSTN